jgi:benzodiazapine receptor
METTVIAAGMNWQLAGLFLLASFAAGLTGWLFKPGIWYESLVKPAWRPKNWMFPLAWTTIYILSSLAAARVAVLPGNAFAMAFWALQIALNTLWTPVFFGLHRMRAAMVVMGLLWLSVAATTWSFFGLDFWAGMMFLPYLLWVSIAAALNIASIALNPEVKG